MILSQQELKVKIIKGESVYLWLDGKRLEGKLSNEFIRRFADKFSELNWRWISRTQTIDESLYEDFKDKIDIHLMCNNRKARISEKFIQKNIDKLSSSDICHLPLSPEFIDANLDHIDFWRLSNNARIDERVFDKYSDKRLDWFALSCRKSLSAEFTSKFYSKLHLGVLMLSEGFRFDVVPSPDTESYVEAVADAMIQVKNYKYSADQFIREAYLEDRMKLNNSYIDQISMYEELTEEFVRKHINVLNLEYILEYQDMSDELRKEVKDMYLKQDDDNK